MPGTGESSHSPEFIDEQTLFQERIGVVEQELAAGTGNLPPTYFLAAEEVEFKLKPAEEDWTEEEYDEMVLFPYENDLLTPRQVAPLPERKRQAKVEQAKERARALIGQLEPQNELERDRKEIWLSQIDSFTTSDAINFQLYEEFSKPTLGDPAVPQGATYEEMEAYAGARGWVEFRFGPETQQSGYYDSPGVPETRLTPCPPSELAERSQAVLERLGQIAGEYGMMAGFVSRHVNLGLYQAGGAGVRQPILGRDPSRQEQTLDAVTGIATSLEEGDWVNETGAYEGSSFAGDPTHFRISSRDRAAMTVKQDYLEFREGTIIASVQHGLLVMMASIAHGLEHGRDALLPSDLQPHIVERPVRVGQEFQGDLQRVFENTTQAPDGSFQLDEQYNNEHSHEVTAALIGQGVVQEDNKAQQQAFNELTMRALRLNDEGSVYCTGDTLQTAFGSLDDTAKEALSTLIFMRVDILKDAVIGQINNRLRAVRLEKRDFIEGEATFTPALPAERAGRLVGSPIFQRMYGDMAIPYANHLADIGQEYAKIA